MALVELPSGILISNVEVTHYTPQFVTTSLNLKRNSKDRGIHQLRGTFDVTVSGERENKKFESWLVKMKGRLNYMNLDLGGRFSAASHLSQNPQIAVDTPIGTTQVNVKNIVGEIWEGDFVNFLNDPKVYVIGNDLVGSGNISITPALKTIQLNNAVTQMQNVIVRANLTEDMQTLSYNEGGIITEYTCTWEEFL